MSAMELLSFRASAPGVSSFAATTMLTGNSNIIREFSQELYKAWILCFWGKHQTAGEIRATSPNFLDGTQGIRLFDIASEVQPLTTLASIHPVVPNDTITFQLTGSATGGDLEFGNCIVYYQDLGTIRANLIDADELRARGGRYVSVPNTLSLGTGGDYSGEEAINAEFDLLKPNKYYALCGANMSAECDAIRWRGIDTGNLGVGLPGNDTLKFMTANWFVWLSEMMRAATGKPGKTIPVFYGTNKSTILIDGVQDENGTDVTVNSLFQILDDDTLS